MKLVIFDVDGTLVDSQLHIVASLTTAFEVVNMPLPPRAELLSTVGLSLPLAIQVLASDADDVTLNTMVETYKETYKRLRIELGAQASPMFDGAEQAIRRLGAHDDVMLAIATGKSRRGLRVLMDGWGFSDLFMSAQCADDHPSKPDPSMVQTCMSDCGVEPQNTVVVGDTTFDMDMGKSAGAATVGVTWGYHETSALRQCGATQIIDSFNALDGALTQIWKG